MFKDIVSNEEAKRFLQNELRMKKSSATYLFNGKRGSNPMEFALAFAKANLCEEEENDFCGVCSRCRRVDSGNYPDLHIYGHEGTIKIDEVREIIYKASSTSYEGDKRIFILDNVENLRKEAANALLKSIEEPEEGTFFILLSETLNIIPTILSRSILVNIAKKNMEELGVTKGEYDFFFGNTREIEEYKRRGLDISHEESYRDIGALLKEYKEEQDLEVKIRVYRALRDFMGRRISLDNLDKMYFAQEIAKGLAKSKGFDRTREAAEEMMYCATLLAKTPEKMEKLLEMKGYNKFNVNLSLLLKIFFLEI